MSITIVIVDDHKMIREGLRLLVSQQNNMEVIGEAENGRKAIELVETLCPDIVIMDIAMPVLNGLEATRRVVAQSQKTKVVVLSMHSDKRFVSEAFRAGASGYLLKDCAFEELLHAIQAIVDNQTYISPSIANTVMEGYIHNLSSEKSAISSPLTPREREVLQLIAEGESTKQIAKMLNVSTKTVESHRRQIMERLDIRNIAELTKYAIREGLTSVEK